MDLENVSLKKAEQIATIIMNRPEKMNALGPGMLNDISAALNEAAGDDEVRVVIITGAGRAFCAGGDFDYSAIRKGNPPLLGRERMAQYLGKGKIPEQHYIKLPLELQRLQKPTIAMINGDAVGGGFDLALACDLRVASQKARLAVGYTRVCALPVMGGAWLLPRIVGLSKAMELLLTSDFISAEEAARLGMLTRAVPPEDLEGETMDLARKLVKAPPISQRLVKMVVHRSLEVDLETSLLFTAACNFIAEGSEDNVEAIRAFAEKRAPVFKDR